MHPIEQQIYEYIEQVSLGNKELSDAEVEEFGERCKAALKSKITELKNQKFYLRMSNIGRPLRQLMLEKQYGRPTPTPEFSIKMLYGSLYEALTILLLKASCGLKEYDIPVALPIAGIKLEGTLDVKIGNKVYDIKTASPYAYEHKFTSWESLYNSDDFGYLAQGFGYAKANGNRFGGWIVINKSTGEFKVVEIPEHEHDRLMSEKLQEISDKIEHINTNKPIPPCENVIEETYYRKPTGNVVLGDACRFCPRKDICHPGIKYCASPVSKSENPVYKWYIKLKEMVA